LEEGQKLVISKLSKSQAVEPLILLCIAAKVPCTDRGREIRRDRSVFCAQKMLDNRASHSLGRITHQGDQRLPYGSIMALTQALQGHQPHFLRRVVYRLQEERLGLLGEITTEDHLLDLLDDLGVGILESRCPRLQRVTALITEQILEEGDARLVGAKVDKGE